MTSDLLHHHCLSSLESIGHRSWTKKRRVTFLLQSWSLTRNSVFKCARIIWYNIGSLSPGFKHLLYNVKYRHVVFKQILPQSKKFCTSACALNLLAGDCLNDTHFLAMCSPTYVLPLSLKHQLSSSSQFQYQEYHELVNYTLCPQFIPIKKKKSRQWVMSFECSLKCN